MGCYGCILYRVHHALITIRRDFQFHYQQFIASQDSRISKLRDALHKVEVQKRSSGSVNPSMAGLQL